MPVITALPFSEEPVDTLMKAWKISSTICIKLNYA